MQSTKIIKLVMSITAATLLFVSGGSSATEEEELMQEFAPTLHKVYEAGAKYRAGERSGMLRASPAQEELRQVYNVIHKQMGHAHDPQKHDEVVLKSCNWKTAAFCGACIAAAVAACGGPEDVPCVALALGALTAADIATKGRCLKCLD